MAAPELTFSVTGNRISDKSGFDHVTVTFSSDIAYTAFECRATKDGEIWGRGVGKLVASFSSTPAGAQRSFDVYDDYLISGEGDYRISLFAQGEDGSWNDNAGLRTSDGKLLHTSDGRLLLTMR